MREPCDIFDPTNRPLKQRARLRVVWLMSRHGLTGLDRRSRARSSVWRRGSSAGRVR